MAKSQKYWHKFRGKCFLTDECKKLNTTTDSTEMYVEFPEEGVLRVARSLINSIEEAFCDEYKSLIEKYGIYLSSDGNRSYLLFSDVEKNYNLYGVEMGTLEYFIYCICQRIYKK